MQIEAGAKQLHAHGAALDVPAGPPFSPRGGTKALSVLGRSRLPQREISHGFLLILIATDPFPNPHRVEVQFHKLTVMATRAAVFLDAEIYRAVRRFVSEATNHELFDEGEDVRDVAGRARRLVGQAAVEHWQVFKKCGLQPAREL